MSATPELYKLSATDIVNLLKEGLVRLAAARYGSVACARSEIRFHAGHTSAAGRGS